MNHQCKIGLLTWSVLILFGCQKPSAPQHNAIPVRDLFTNITAQAGISFSHDAGPTGRYLMPEQMGSGCALFDFDNDGRLDILLIQNGGPSSQSRNVLYHQLANGRFEDVSAGSGLDVAGFGMGAAIGDANNDGLPDVLITEYGAAKLFQNKGRGKFTDISQQARIDNPRWATSASFFDYDRDGWLDIVIGNYLDYDPTHKCINSRGEHDFCGPHGFPGLAPRLFHNDGAAHFTDATVASGLAGAPGPALGVLCADFDGDKWPDIFFADDGKPNRLFLNKQNGTFAEEATPRGIAYNTMGQTAGNMGIGVGDVNGDGLFDLFVTHLAEELHTLWLQQTRGVFQDRTALAGLTDQRWRGTGFGAALADLDLDGDLDLAFVNGLVKRSSDKVTNAIAGLPSFWTAYAQRSQVFANNGQGQFREVSQENPAFCGSALVGRGMACGDINNDGKVDILVTGAGGAAQLFQNVAGSSNRWLIVRAVDPALGGRDAYGAEVTISVGDKKFWRLLQPGSSYLSSSDPRLHFGLGTNSHVDGIHVLWPDGSEEEFPGSDSNQIIILRRSSKSVP